MMTILRTLPIMMWAIAAVPVPGATQAGGAHVGHARQDGCDVTPLAHDAG